MTAADALARKDAAEEIVTLRLFLREHVRCRNVPTREQRHLQTLPVQTTAESPALRKRRRSVDSALFYTSRPSPSERNPRILLEHLVDNLSALRGSMLAAPIDLTFDDDSDWLPPSDVKNRLIRTASVGNSWGVTSIGGGYSWSSRSKNNQRHEEHAEDEVPTKGSFIAPESPKGTRPLSLAGLNATNGFLASIPSASICSPSLASIANGEPLHAGVFTEEPVSTETVFARSPHSSSLSSMPSTPVSVSPSLTGDSGSSRTYLHRSSSMPRPRRRSSQQRVSLVAGRLSMVSIDPPEDQLSPPKLQRVGSQSSFLSAMSTRAPTPSAERDSFLGGRSISEFVIEGDLGKGAYGLVKRAREMHLDGTEGSPVIIKQIIKLRILADCWKKHPKFGTIPIEIYVMSSISSTCYVLPPKRPWDPSRLYPAPEGDLDTWIEGKVVKGHPNICQLLDFFEDKDYYYLVMPCTTPAKGPGGETPPSDLFDLVESYPQGLPPGLIRSYLGQIADALAFLHAKNIVHRDVKDENVVLGQKPGSCILIDFGSSGIVKNNGWDTFSGTLDYAGPEILLGDRYHGKEQDVWAFGVVAFVLLIGECPFNTAAEAVEGLESPFCNALIALDERCGDGKEHEGEEPDGGGALGDAAALVRACLRVDLTQRPTMEKILECRFLSGGRGWGMEA